MTPLRSIPVLLLLFSVLTVISGCARKKPVLVVVPSEQPPIAAPTPAPTPSEKTEPGKPGPEEQPAEQPSTAEKTSTDTTAKNKPRARQRGTIKKPSPIVKGETTAAEAKPPEPRSTPAPIAPSISPSDAARDQSSTEQLLQTTENTLSGIKRQLSKDEEAMVAQIRNYISQSRQATKDNDPARAHNLALKANLLSNELIRR